MITVCFLSGRFVELFVTERDKQTISNKFDVLLHEVRIHAEQSARKSLSQELLLDLYCLGDDILNSLLAWAVVQVGKQEAGEVRVHALITGDEFVGECKTGH